MGWKGLEFTNCTPAYISEDKSMQLCYIVGNFIFMYIYVYCK